MKTVLIVCFFTFMIHLAETLALSMRLAGVRTKQVATSISFVNASFLVSRMSNMLQAPLLGAMVDSAVNPNSIFNATMLGANFRWIIFAAFWGNLLGAFLTPTFAYIFEKGIYIFEKEGSIPKLIGAALRPRNMKLIITSFRAPTFSSLQNISWNRIPHLFLYLNVLMVSIYAIGVLASLYAGAQLPDFRATAANLSGIVNGMATILLAIMVDPSGAHIVDQVVRGKRPEADARSMVFFLIMGRVFGTLIISQLLFLPSTKYIMAATEFVTRIFGG
ncbi:lipid II flippase family protein [Candidatus Margulisiibacteriota bacterium]